MSISIVLGGALLIKSAYSGFTMPQYAYSLVCEVHADKVVVKHGFGYGADGLSYTETKPVTIGGDITALLRKSMDETVESHDTPCDGPSDELKGYLPEAEDFVVVQTSGGCGTPSIDHSGPASTVIKNLVASICPKE